MKRVAIYIRSAMKDESGKIEKQLERLQEYATENGGTVVGVYIDNGYSGCRMFWRRSLKKMLRQCKKGNIDDVIVLDVSRLSRKYEHFTKICGKLQRYNVTLTSVNGGQYDYTTQNIFSNMGKLARKRGV